VDSSAFLTDAAPRCFAKRASTFWKFSSRDSENVGATGHRPVATGGIARQRFLGVCHSFVIRHWRFVIL
jgi:hypothetical protein